MGDYPLHVCVLHEFKKVYPAWMKVVGIGFMLCAILAILAYGMDYIDSTSNAIVEYLGSIPWFITLIVLITIILPLSYAIMVCIKRRYGADKNTLDACFYLLVVFAMIVLIFSALVTNAFLLVFAFLVLVFSMWML